MSFVLIMMAAWGMGSIGLRSISFADAVEAAAMRLLAGLVPVAYIALIAGSLSLLTAQVTLAAIAVLTLIFCWRSASRGAASHDTRQSWNWLERGALAALLAASGLTLLGTLAPVTSWDACVAHLALPADYTREGHIFTHPGNVYSGYPHFMHALFAVAFYSGSGGYELPVSLLNWTFGLLACAAVYSLGRRIGTRQTGLVAAALLATAPIYMDQAGGVGIDLPFVAYTTATLAALAAWRSDGGRPWLVIAALFAGSACGIRHTGYLCALFSGLGALWLAPPQTRIRSGLLFAGVAALAALPWLARTWLVTGNPVFPLLLSFFPTSPIDHIAISTPGEHESIDRAGGISLWALLRFPWDIIMRPQDYDGWSKSPGGMVLILGVPGLLLGGRRVWGLGAYSVTGGIVFFCFQRLARYMLPFFTPMMVAAALVVEELPRGRRLVASLLCVAFAYGLMLHAAAVHFKVPVVLGMQTRSEYLTDRVERYEAFQFANEHLGDGALLAIDQRTYYLDGPTYQNHWSLKQIAEKDLVEQVSWLHDHHIRYIMLPVDYVAGSGALSGNIGDMLARWRASPQYFAPVGPPLHLRRRDGRGMEEVAFYAVRQ